jgi:hypothetical protein
MTTPRHTEPPSPASNQVLTGPEVVDIGEAMYGAAWAKPMARDLGVSHRSCHGYAQNGAAGAQAAALVGLLARRLHEKAEAELVRRREHEEDTAYWFSYLRDYEARLRQSGPANLI